MVQTGKLTLVLKVNNVVLLLFCLITSPFCVTRGFSVIARMIFFSFFYMHCGFLCIITAKVGHGDTYCGRKCTLACAYTLVCRHSSIQSQHNVNSFQLFFTRLFNMKKKKPKLFFGFSGGRARVCAEVKQRLSFFEELMLQSI